MFKKWFVGLSLVLFCMSISFAQNAKRQNETNWEMLEISGIQTYSTSGNILINYRKYIYLTSEVAFDGQTSLEWIKTSGWELVGVAAYEQIPTSLYFKRAYDKQRTEKEIDWLKKEYEKINQTPKKVDLSDLDIVESKQKLVEFNKTEAAKFRTALEKVKNLPIKIIAVESTSTTLNKSQITAEIVLDATSALLKDGKYRSSEADKYFQESVKQIVEAIGFNIGQRYYESQALRISTGSFKPVEIGKFGYYYGEVNLKISVIINSNNQQSIVAQNIISGKLTSNP